MVMPTSTLELPREMVYAAQSYAAQENRSVADLFADMMKNRYGFTMKIVVPKQARHQKHIVTIPDSIRSISGIVSLPVGVTEADVIHEAVMSN